MPITTSRTIPKVLSGDGEEPALKEIAVAFRRTTHPADGITASDLIKPGQIRRIGVAHLRLWGLSGLADSAALLLTELATNAFQHGAGSLVEATLRRTPRHLHIQVTDRVDEETPSDRHQVPHVRPGGLLDEGGRGLMLVDALADAWGISPDGVTVWCMLDIDTTRRRQ